MYDTDTWFPVMFADVSAIEQVQLDEMVYLIPSEYLVCYIVNTVIKHAVSLTYRLIVGIHIYMYMYSCRYVHI